MILCASVFPEQEDELVQSYVACTEIFNQEELSMLLRSEDNEGLRPLELAAKLGCCRLVKALMETRGVRI